MFYRFVDKDDSILYIGQCSFASLDRTIKEHNYLPDECYKSVVKIETTEEKDEIDWTFGFGDYYGLEIACLVKNEKPKYNYDFYRGEFKNAPKKIRKYKWSPYKGDVKTLRTNPRSIKSYVDGLLDFWLNRAMYRPHQRLELLEILGVYSGRLIDVNRKLYNLQMNFLIEETGITVNTGEEILKYQRAWFIRPVNYSNNNININ